MKQWHKKQIQVHAKLFDRLLAVMMDKQREEYAKILGKKSTPAIRAKVEASGMTERFIAQQKYYSSAFASLVNAKPTKKASIIRSILQYEGIILTVQSLWESATCFEFRYLVCSRTNVEQPPHLKKTFEKFGREHRSFKIKLRNA